MTGTLDRIEARLRAQLPRHRELNSPRWDAITGALALVEVAKAAQARSAPTAPWEWWTQYEETAERLAAAGDASAADDIRTLVDGLRQHEREAAVLAAALARLEDNQ